MRVLVDECVARMLVRLLAGHEFRTAQQMGCKSTKNGVLLDLAERGFDVFLTCDLNLRYQQSLRGRLIALLALSTNHWPTLKHHAALVQSALDGIQPGQYVHLAIPPREQRADANGD